jgi:hypothetical protein
MPLSLEGVQINLLNRIRFSLKNTNPAANLQCFLWAFFGVILAKHRLLQFSACFTALAKFVLLPCFLQAMMVGAVVEINGFLPPPSLRQNS